MNQFKKIFPNNERQLIDGGLNTKFAASIIENNESPDCANVVFSNGSAQTREGVQKFNTTSVGSFVGDGLYTRRASDTSETMVAFWNGCMYAAAGTTFTTIPSAQSVFTAGIRVAAAQQENYIFVCNGGVTPYKYNGTSFTRHGVYPPTTTMTVASNGVGVLSASATYMYKNTYVNSNLVESDLGPAATFVISVTSGQNNLTSIPLAPTSFGVNARKIYRTSANASTFKLLTTISDNTTTTYSDNTLDSALGATAPTDNGVPPNYSAIIYHQGRLFMNDPASPSYVKWTEYNQPYTVATTNFYQVSDNSTDNVKGFAVDNNNLIVFCENSIYIGYIVDPSDDTTWKWVKSKAPYGSKSPFGAFNFADKTGFLAIQNNNFVGIAALSGDSVVPNASLTTVASIRSDMRTEGIEPDMFTVQTSYLGNISSIVHKNLAYVSVTYDTNQTRNNRIYVMDFSGSNVRKNQKEMWVPFTGLNAAQFTIYNGDLYYISSTANGRVYMMNSGQYNDDGAAIDSYIWTKEFVGADTDTNYTKDFRYLNILVDNAGDYYMDITYKVDSDRGSGTTTTLNLDPGGSIWGVMVWGVDAWGGGTDQKEYRLYLANATGRRIQYKFSNQNTVDQRFACHGLNFLYNIKGYR